MDHETSGAQEWQLAGYGRSPPKSHSHLQQTSSVFPSTPPRNKAHQTSSAQPGVLFPSSPPRNKVEKREATKVAPGKAIVRPKQPYKPYKGRGGRHLPSKIFRDSPAKSAWRAGDKPTGHLNLPACFGSFRDQFFSAARSTMLVRKLQGIPDRHEVFFNIGHKTGSYIRTPSYNDKIIYLWGETAQVVSAKEILQSLLAKCSFSAPRVSAPNKRSEWAKIYAKNPKKEATAELKEHRENKIMILRNEPESLSTFPEKLLFLWPKEGPSLLESLGPKLETLDVIRAEFRCHLFVPKDLPDFICAVADNHDNIKSIARRLRTKWAEIMASSNIKSKVYVIEPPNAEVMKKKITIRRLEAEQWNSRAALIRSKNNARILTAIEKSLKGVVYVRGHLRMRVNLGSFVLDEYRAPVDDKASYSFEEFREMLSYEQTKGRLIPGLKISPENLLAKCTEATHLLEPHKSNGSSLAEVEPVYSVNFEFSGANSSILRLEVEFSKASLCEEGEITQRRWLRPRRSGQSTDKRSPLQIGVIDFTRSDWQLEIKSLEFHEGSSIDSSLHSFSRTIRFHCSPDNDIFSAQPQRKVFFSDSPPVSRLVEKTAFRYGLKGTNYVFEIARYDEYTRPDAFGLVSEASKTVSTSWGASIFDPAWDTSFGGQANLPVGHSAKYNPNLDTFFPPKEASSSARGAGFWEFIELVKQAGELLGPTRGSE